MSLPSFKFTNIGVPTSNDRVNSGMSSSSKMDKTGILSSITEKAQDTFKDVKLPDISIDTDIGSNVEKEDADSSSLFSFTGLVKIILVIVIVWFMWTSLSKNDDFYLGMGQVGHNLQNFFKTMEKRGREVVSRITNQPISPSSESESSDTDSDGDDESKIRNVANVKKRSQQPVSRINPATYQPPIPPPMTNSSNKTPGFIHDDAKYTFLDKANRSYKGPSPRADDTTSVTQKHQSGKAGFCYIGEDRGFRSCLKVEAGDKCMSDQVFSTHEICVNPSLRE
ncbi:hypothetical protein EBU71_16655 [bacterium]|nr:hypothetical protein [Candidatus Elulimicrobium humile]